MEKSKELRLYGLAVKVEKSSDDEGKQKRLAGRVWLYFA